MNCFRPVVIAGTGSFLPNAPVPTSTIDAVLGVLDQAPPRVQSFLEKVGRRMLEQSGIEFRHFAVDPETHKLTHTVASLGEQAARRALDAAGMSARDVELLVLSSPMPDSMTPPTSTVLQERLGIEHCAEMEIHSNCSGVGKSMQVAFDGLRTGRYKTALVVYAQLSSANLRSCYFNQAKVTRTQATLRYILADGSGAVALRGVDPSTNGPIPHEVLGTHVESVGGRLPAAMTAGLSAGDMVDSEAALLKIFDRGSHHLDQDFSAVKQLAGRLLFEGARRMVSSLGIDAKTVAHIVASVPTKPLYEDSVAMFVDYFGPAPGVAKFRGTRTGYCGGASILIHFDQMVRSNEIHAGEIVLVHSVESSKWMSAGFVVRW